MLYQGRVDGGRLKHGVFPIWAYPSQFVLFGAFPIFSNTESGNFSKMGAPWSGKPPGLPSPKCLEALFRCRFAFWNCLTRSSKTHEGGGEISQRDPIFRNDPPRYSLLAIYTAILGKTPDRRTKSSGTFGPKGVMRQHASKKGSWKVLEIAL